MPVSLGVLGTWKERQAEVLQPLPLWAVAVPRAGRAAVVAVAGSLDSLPDCWAGLLGCHCSYSAAAAPLQHFLGLLRQKTNFLYIFVSIEKGLISNNIPLQTIMANH